MTTNDETKKEIKKVLLDIYKAGVEDGTRAVIRTFKGLPKETQVEALSKDEDELAALFIDACEKSLGTVSELIDFYSADPEEIFQACASTNLEEEC